MWTHLKADRSSWTATIIAGTITPELVDVDELLQSARTQSDCETFYKVWSQDGVLNSAKRTFLSAIRKTLEREAEHASYEVLRRLQVVRWDFSVSNSSDRQAVIDLLAGEVTDPSTAAGLLSELRSIALRDGKIAGSYTRFSLRSALSRQCGILFNRSRLEDNVERLVQMIEMVDCDLNIDAAMRALDFEDTLRGALLTLALSDQKPSVKKLDEVLAGKETREAKLRVARFKKSAAEVINALSAQAETLNTKMQNLRYEVDQIARMSEPWRPVQPSTQSLPEEQKTILIGKYIEDLQTYERNHAAYRARRERGLALEMELHNVEREHREMVTRMTLQRGSIRRQGAQVRG